MLAVNNRGGERVTPRTDAVSACLIAASMLVVAMPATAQYQPPTYTRTIEDFRKTVSVDLVAKVLNYSDGLATDEGNAYEFWYAYDAKNCIYRKAKYKSTSAYDAKTAVFDVDENSRELRLNDLGTNSVRYTSQGINHPSVLGSPPTTTNLVTVSGDGRIIFQTDGLDPDRINKGWGVLLKQCKGTPKAF